MPWKIVTVVGLCVATLGAVYVKRRYDPAAVAVTAVGETDAVPSEGDAADDPAVWVCPTDPARSLIVGTDKNGGLGVYGLDGRELQFISVDGEQFNNVDVRDGFPLAGAAVSLVAAGETTREQLVLYRVDAVARRLVEVPAGRINLGVDPEGVALHRSPTTGAMFAFVVGDGRGSDEQGVIEQWAIEPGDRFPIEGTRVRRIVLGDTAEGMVADDRAGHLYVSEEARGIWRFDAAPDGGTDGRLVAEVGPRALLGDVEGLAILERGDGRYLIASSQGSNDFVVYRIGDGLDLVGRFEVAGGDVDEVTHTDGIEVVSRPLGPRFPEGLFVCQDDDNEAENQNFKLVSVADIADALDLP